jgi:hypothetical protein
VIAAPAIHAIAPACKGGQLAGRFAVVPGSAGAGNIVYKLTLTNTSWAPCTVTGLPEARLLGKTKKGLPTRIRAANPGALAAVLVTLRHGRKTVATARFSPDVNGVGEPGNPCEPRAYWLRVTGQGGGTTTVPIVPATSVCEHGSLAFTAYGS